MSYCISGTEKPKKKRLVNRRKKFEKENKKD